MKLIENDFDEVLDELNNEKPLNKLELIPDNFDIGLLNKNKYIEKLNEFIQENGTRFLSKNGPEPVHTHHIKMRSLNGSDDKSNLVNLTYEQHKQAHLILAEENQDSIQAQEAALWFDLSEKDKIVVMRRYARALSQSMSGANNPNYSKNYTEDEIDKIKAATKAGLKHADLSFIVTRLEKYNDSRTAEPVEKRMKLSEIEEETGLDREIILDNLNEITSKKLLDNNYVSLSLRFPKVEVAAIPVSIVRAAAEKEQKLTKDSAIYFDSIYSAAKDCFGEKWRNYYQDIRRCMSNNSLLSDDNILRYTMKQRGGYYWFYKKIWDNHFGACQLRLLQDYRIGSKLNDNRNVLNTTNENFIFKDKWELYQEAYKLDNRLNNILEEDLLSIYNLCEQLSIINELIDLEE